MKEILVGIFGTTAQPLQWYLFALGVLLALILRMTGVPPLAFALGMYLPMELNTPVLLGGILSWLVARRSESDDDSTVKVPRTWPQESDRRPASSRITAPASGKPMSSHMREKTPSAAVGTCSLAASAVSAVTWSPSR